MSRIVESLYNIYNEDISINEHARTDLGVGIWLDDLVDEFFDVYRGLDDYFNNERHLDINSTDYAKAEQAFIEWLYSNPNFIKEAKEEFEHSLNYYTNIK